MDFDIIICVGPKDNNIVNSSVECAKKNIIGYRNIYLVCATPTINIDGAITIDEQIFPFNIGDIENQFGKLDRNGWYLQQLLKLYSGIIIPGILQKYLVIDCDTHFLRPTKFFSEDGKQMLTTGTEYTIPYFEHMNRLHPSLKKVHPLSGISHHTFFDTECILGLFKLVEEYHNDIFWKIYLNQIDKSEYLKSAAAENETYFTYMCLYHNDKINIRQLEWENKHYLDLNDNYDFVSVHWYLRRF
jgi:hypothetical protein